MPARASNRSAPTRLSLRAMSADAVHRLLLSPRGQVATLDEIAGLLDLQGWNREAIDLAVADLVADGKLSDDERGRLVVHPANRAA